MEQLFKPEISVTRHIGGVQARQNAIPCVPFEAVTVATCSVSARVRIPYFGEHALLVVSPCHHRV